jgi:hypothetical protein
MGSSKKRPVVIDAAFRVVGDKPEREPIIGSWAALIWFVVALGIGYALKLWSYHLKGWL